MRRKNPINYCVTDDEEDDIIGSALYFGEKCVGPRYDLGNGYSLRVSNHEDNLHWGITFRGKVIGGGIFNRPRDIGGKWAEELVGIKQKHQGKGLHRRALAVIRGLVGPFYSDDSRSASNESSWAKYPGATFDAEKDRWYTNPRRRRNPTYIRPQDIPSDADLVCQEDSFRDVDLFTEAWSAHLDRVYTHRDDAIAAIMRYAPFSALKIPCRGIPGSYSIVHPFIKRKGTGHWQATMFGKDDVPYTDHVFKTVEECLIDLHRYYKANLSKVEIVYIGKGSR